MTSATATPRLSPAWYGGETWGMLQDPYFWVARIDSLSASWNIFALGILPWVVINGWAVLRWSTLLLLAASAVGVNILVDLGLALLNGSDLATGPVFVTGAFAFRWFAQLIPALVAPVLLGGALKPFVKHAIRLQFASMFALIAFSFFVLSILAPAFIAASPGMQVALRVVAFTLGFELAIASMRVCTKVAFTPYLPRDRLIALAGQAIIVAGISGRFLTGSMDSTAGTVLIATLISVIELTLRLTLPARDRLILGWCLAVCPQCRATARRSKGLHADPHFKAKVLLPSAGQQDTHALQPPTSQAAGPTAHARNDTSSISLQSSNGSGGDPLAQSPRADSFDADKGKSHSDNGNGRGSPGATDLIDDVSSSLVLDSSLKGAPKQGNPVVYLPGSGTPPDSLQPVTIQPLAADQKPFAGAVVPMLALESGDESHGERGALRRHEGAADLPPAAAPEQSDLTPDQRIEAALLTAKRRAAREAQDVHSFFSLLTLDTMAEDVGILASLAFGLLFRTPSRQGGAPAVVTDVLIRVLVQYVLEFLTDLAPALTAWAVNTCCGVRWRKARKHAIRAAVRRAMLRAQLPQNDDGVGTPFVTDSGDVEWRPERGISALEAATAEVAGELQGGELLDDTADGADEEADDNREDSINDGMVEVPAVWSSHAGVITVGHIVSLQPDEVGAQAQRMQLSAVNTQQHYPMVAQASLSTIRELDNENESAPGSTLPVTSSRTGSFGTMGSGLYRRPTSVGSSTLSAMQAHTPGCTEAKAGAGSPLVKASSSPVRGPGMPLALTEVSDEDTDTDTSNSAPRSLMGRDGALQSASDNSGRITLQQHAVPAPHSGAGEGVQPPLSNEGGGTSKLLASSSVDEHSGVDDHATGVDAEAASAFKQSTAPSGWRQLLNCACCRSCVLHSTDDDVAEQRNKLLGQYATEIRAITRDAVWQPIEWRQLLKIGVEGSARHRRRSRAHSASDTASLSSGAVQGRGAAHGMLHGSSRISVASEGAGDGAVAPHSPPPPG